MPCKHFVDFSFVFAEIFLVEYQFPANPNMRGYEAKIEKVSSLEQGPYDDQAVVNKS